MMRRSVLALCLLILCSCAGVQSRYYTWRQGDRLALVAQRFDVTDSALRRYNRAVIAKGLEPGTKLYLPFETNPHWNEGTVLSQAPVEREPIGNSSREPFPIPPRSQKRRLRELASLNFRWPVRGKISSFFGRRHGGFHEGIDIAARRGTPVVAARAGDVIYAGSHISGFGNLVILRHRNSFATVYAHLSRLGVKKGQFVSRGQRIGLVGATGHATGPHLHFEIRQGQLPLDPLLFLPHHYMVSAQR